MKKYTEVLFSIGGNREVDTLRNIELQLALLPLLAESHIFPSIFSSFYRTPAYPAGIGNDFVNSILVAQTDISAEAVLHVCHQIEAEFGRERKIRWGERVIDIDIISYGNQILPDLSGFERWRDLPMERQREETPSQLILPHPRVQDRAFVLVPLCEVRPDWVHPVMKQSAQTLCTALPKAEREAVRPIDGTRVVYYPDPV